MQIHENIKIVLIDSNSFNLELNLQFLKLVGYKNISTFKDVESYKTIGAKNPPQLIIIDRNTDDSLKFIQEVKKTTPEIYIIVLVESTQIHDGQTSIEYGAYDFIIKDEETVTKIKAALNKVHDVIDILETNKITPKQKFFRLITFI